MEFLPSMRDPKENPNKLVQNTNQSNHLTPYSNSLTNTNTTYIREYLFRNRKGVGFTIQEKKETRVEWRFRHETLSCRALSYPHQRVTTIPSNQLDKTTTYI